MWIEKKVDKTTGKLLGYLYRDRYLDPRTGKWKKIAVTLPNKSRETQNEAKNILNRKIESALKKESVIKPSLTFHKLIDEWYVIYKNQVKEPTYLTTNNLLNTVRKKIKSDILVSGITTLDLNNLFEELLYKDQLSNKYVSIIKSKINLIFMYALKKNYVLENPVSSVIVTYKREQKSSVRIKDKFLEDDEYRAIIDYTMAHNKRYGLLFQWLYLTGMRGGEAIALMKEDIVSDDEGTYAVISGTLEYRERKITDVSKSTETKTAAGMRNVYLPLKAFDVLKQFQEINQDIDTNFIFTTSNGTPILLTAINGYLRKLKSLINIDKPLSSHIFRHTHISKLAEIGTPMYAIQERVGHENSQITQRIYLHVTKKVKDKVKKDIELL